MKEKDFNLFLEDWSLNSSFRFLDEGKDKKEIETIAEKARIVWPSPDLAIFKCVYAFVDRVNKNGCILPKEEVEKSLPTLIGKSIDLDHFRKKVVGHWIDAKLEGDQIIAYGSIFKSSFQEDFKVIKELLDGGNLSISFESWGHKIPKADGSYELVDQIYAGGALLIKEVPAFDGADVLEMAKDRILEFAKVMTKPDTFLHLEKHKGSFHLTEEKVRKLHNVLMALIEQLNKEEDLDKKAGLIVKWEDDYYKELYNMSSTENLEESSYHIYDSQAIMQALSDVECASCNEKYMQDIMMMDYENNKAKTKCVNCGAEMMVNMTPQSKLTKKGRKIKSATDLSYKGQIEDVEKYVAEFEGSNIALEMLLEQSLNRPVNISYEQRTELNDEDFAIVGTIGNKKIRILPIHSLAHIDDVDVRLEQSQVEVIMSKLGLSKDNVKRKLKKRKTYWAMKDLMEKYKKGTPVEVIQEIAKATIGRELTKEELEMAQLSVTNLQTLRAGPGGASPQSLQALSKVTPANDNSAHPSKSDSNATSLQTAMTEEDIKKIITMVTVKPEAAQKLGELEQIKLQLIEATRKLEEATKKVEEFEKAKREAEKAAQDALIKARKDELGDFAKDMKDEDILDEVKFENAKLKKENADLRAGKKIEPAKKKELDLAKGSTDKKIDEDFKKTRQRVDEMAWGKYSKDSKEEDKE